MRDEFHRSKSRKQKNHQLNFRFVVFLTAVTMMFGVLSVALYRLQVENGETYAASTGKQSIKSIAIKGSRGMITDVNSVVLAKSEKAYTVTFYRESNDWDYPTKQLLDAIGIVEKHGGSISVTSPLKRNEETNQWEFNFGDGISENAWNIRKNYFYSNNYVSASKFPTAESSFYELCKRYGFTILPDGRYLLALRSDTEAEVLDGEKLVRTDGGNGAEQDAEGTEPGEQASEVYEEAEAPDGEMLVRTDGENGAEQDAEGTEPGEQATGAYEKVVDLSLISQQSSRIKEYRVVDEETVLKVLAINATMQDNAFNSLPIAFAEDVSYETVSEIEGRSMSMPWVSISMGDKRVYPNGSLAATIIGYTGKIQNADYYYSDLKPAGYAMNDYIGQAGIENSMENWLTANITERQGAQVVEVDPAGKVTRTLSYNAPQNGNTVHLTINAQYQTAAERAIQNNVQRTRRIQEEQMQDPQWMENNKDKIATRDWEEFPIRLATTGVLIVMDLREGNAGNLLALAQYPNYDLNAMVRGGEAAQQIVEDERGLLMNYAVQTRAEPGSIFKMVTGLAALTNGALTPTETISDEGRFNWFTNVAADMPKCWTNYPSNHQNQTIVEGLTNSCNYFFYTLGGRLYKMDNTERLYKYAAQMGLTSKTGIDLPGELRPIVGNQTNLYDQTVSLNEQMTDTPAIVAAAIKKHLINYGASYGIEYDSARLDRCIKLLMDMAVNTGSDDWVVNARPIFMTELNMTRTMVMQAALMRDLWTYLNTIKWGGSQEIQMGIGQSITLLTPITVVRYIGAITNDAVVWNPNIIDSIVSPEGEILSQRTATQFNVLESAKPYMQYILQGLEGVVDETGTAAKQFRDWKYKPKEVMYGKTGTSQVTIGKIKLDLENNGWFVAMCPNTKPEIAVVSFIPNGYSGAYTTRAAREFLEFYLDERSKVDVNLSLPGGNSLAP